MKLNLGCGQDYKQGFINIDGADNLKVDKRIDFIKETLLDYFNANEIKFILAKDFIEHFYSWEAKRILHNCYLILENQGIIEIHIPNLNHIISTRKMSLDNKITMIYGGQGKPQGKSKLNETRIKYPHYFCHKYGYTRVSIALLLRSLGFAKIEIKESIGKTSLIIKATKE